MTSCMCKLTCLAASIPAAVSSTLGAAHEVCRSRTTHAEHLSRPSTRRMTHLSNSPYVVRCGNNRAAVALRLINSSAAVSTRQSVSRAFTMTTIQSGHRCILPGPAWCSRCSTQGTCHTLLRPSCLPGAHSAPCETWQPLCWMMLCSETPQHQHLMCWCWQLPPHYCCCQPLQL